MGVRRLDTVVFGLLKECGLLLLTDKHLPSVTGLVAGGPIRGSWWGHPKGHTIYAASLALEDHHEVVVARLISGKVTYVHRSLWVPLLSVATAREPWQLGGLSTGAHRLLRRVSGEGRVGGGAARGVPGGLVRELELRLLLHTEEVHMVAGAHGKVVETWETWARRRGLHWEALPPPEARRRLEEVVASLNDRYGGKGTLPWPPSKG